MSHEIGGEQVLQRPMTPAVGISVRIFRRMADMFRLVVSVSTEVKYVLTAPRITRETTVGQLRSIIRDTVAEFYNITLSSDTIVLRHASKQADIRDLTAPYVGRFSESCLRACASAFHT